MADAAVVALGGQTMTITYTGLGANVDTQGTFANGMVLRAIKFKPSAEDDELIIREGSGTGNVICEMKDVAGGGVKDFLHRKRCKPYILLSEQTFNDPTAVVIMFDLW